VSRRPFIAVVDYGMGNRRSVQKALEHVGAQAAISAAPERLRAADGLVAPGVGAFPRAMQNINHLGLDRLLGEAAADGKPLLGICLGMQVLFESSSELTPTAGLGLLPGTVTRLQTGGLRIPHIGWNEVRFEHNSPLTAGLPEAGRPFYHVHSMAVRPASAADVVGSTDYGERFATVVQRGNVFGVQFHPEKSSVDGLALLANFVRACREHKAGQGQVAAVGA
jgi:imidazole glycerol-phosphate synthase subunit HisH